MGSEGNGVSSGDEINIDIGQNRKCDILLKVAKQFEDEQSDYGVAAYEPEDEKRNVSANAGSSEKLDMGYQVIRRGSGDCITAPSGVGKNLILENNEVSYSTSMTEKRESPRHELRLKRSSNTDKKDPIVNLVNIQNDEKVEADLTKNEPAASELLDFQSREGSFCRTNTVATKFNLSVPSMKIAMLVAGTRGDVQPFLAIAKKLQEYGHHVRLATHVNFSSFIKSAGVDFYPLGGDPRVLAGYASRNKGLIPSAPGEIFTHRKQVKSIIESVFPACTAPDLKSGQSFKAQAIIANPVAYGHMHVAEALGVPIQILFTLPWTPTYEFPHPLIRVPQSAAYWLSYIVADLFVWWGIKGYINDFRKKKLNLPPIAYFSLYHGSIAHLPTAYMWSPHLVPKPNDWGPLVDVVGYCFLDLVSKYQPPKDLVQWLQKGPQPIYIGFGSMLLEDPKKTTDVVLEALRKTRLRGIIGRGWGDLGTLAGNSEDVYLLGDCPHDWLFPQCLAVVHHGGAGTTAAGLRAGLPTTIVPFFGDQYFWGERIHKKGLGPYPIPISELTIESLSAAITFMLQPEVKSRALEIAKQLEKENGIAGAVDAFHRHLPSELPLPRSLSRKDDHPSSFQWVFTQIGGICSIACGGL